MRRLIWIFLLILSSFFLIGQKKSDFYLLADKRILKLYQNPDECIASTLALITSDKNPEEKIVIRNIVSQAYAMKGDYVQSVKSSLEEAQTQPTADAFFSDVYQNYGLAEQYQNLGLYDLSEKIIHKILNEKKLAEQPNAENAVTVAKLYQLQAINLAIKSNTDKSVAMLDMSNKFVKSGTNEIEIIKSENQLIRALLYLRKNQVQKAENTILEVQKNILNKNYFFLEALSLDNLSRIRFHEGQYAEAVDLLQLALKKIESANYLPLQSRIYESLYKNYAMLNQTDRYKEYYKLFLDSKTKLNNSKKEGIRYLTKLTQARENAEVQRFTQEKKSNLIWNSVLGMMILGGIFLYFMNEKKQNRELLKQLHFFNRQEEKRKKTEIRPIEPEPKAQELTKDARKISLLSKEKELEILQKLDELENSDRFLNKNMSLANLASQMDTNTRYLSEVINNYKGKNFNLYVNELRINHIADLLKNNPAYLNYKVSYLAEFSGFSSHSAFTTVFKTITGMSPNAYIQQLNEKKK